jgi:predicted ribosomally synthesized peptide with SipW-like signal peptide
MNKQILLSILVISTAVALISGATLAYVNDVETSTGNTFTAGEIDLKIDYDCYYNKLVDGTTSCPSWTPVDLTIEKFFDFNDVKPGDYGEGTISLNVDNDAWVCARVYNLESKENNCNEPEQNAETNCASNDVGELQDNLYFTIWLDNGAGLGHKCNNILDDDEKPVVVNNEKAKPIVWAIADPTTGKPLPAGKNCIGVKWNVPSGVGNIIQSDSLKGDIKFWTEQSRNNPDFRCKEIVHYPEDTAYVGYEDRTSGDFDYNDFGIMDMHLKETYADDCLSEVDMDFTVKVKLAGDVHDIHIKRLFSSNTDYAYTITRSSPAQGTEKPAGAYTGSDDLDVILFDSATTPILGDKVVIHVEINHCDDYFNPTPTKPRWDLDPFMANYDPWMNDKSIGATRHIVDWQTTTTFGDPSPGIAVPYILVIPAPNWIPPGEGVKITTPYQYFDDYYRSLGVSHPQWYLGI